MRILGKYTFFLGIPCTFSFRDVRISIEKDLCVYTEQEIMNDNTRLNCRFYLKSRFKAVKHWSIFCRKKEVMFDYIVGDKLDTEISRRSEKAR